MSDIIYRKVTPDKVIKARTLIPSPNVTVKVIKSKKVPDARSDQ